MFLKCHENAEKSQLENGCGENPSKKKDEIERSVLQLKTMRRNGSAQENMEDKKPPE